jgi:hypothetical protein
VEAVTAADETMQRFVVYRCPRTGMRVQATFAAKDGEEAEDRSQNYQSVSCPACARMHFVNVKTGKLLGPDTE